MTNRDRQCKTLTDKSKSQSKILKFRQRDKQTDRQIERQNNRKTDRYTDGPYKLSDIQKDRLTDSQNNND